MCAYALRACMQVYLYACTYVYVHKCMYACTIVCVYACLYACIMGGCSSFFEQKVQVAGNFCLSEHNC